MTRLRCGSSSRCIRCRLQTQFCICETLPSLKVKNFYTILMHIKEMSLTSNSAHFYKDIIPTQCQIHLRGKLGAPLDYSKVFIHGYTPLYLFPTEDAVELAELLPTINGPIQLIIPDATWSQAIKFRKRDEELKKLKCVKINPTRSTRYVLRTAIREGQLSTFEAIAQAMEVLEGTEITKELYKFFDNFVQTSLRMRNKMDRYNEFTK